MPITKRNELTQTVDPQGRISVLTVTIIEEDGVELARTNHRSILEPGDSTDGQPADVVAVANAVWSPQKVARAAARRAAREAARLAAGA